MSFNIIHFVKIPWKSKNLKMLCLWIIFCMISCTSNTYVNSTSNQLLLLFSIINIFDMNIILYSWGKLIRLTRIYNYIVLINPKYIKIHYTVYTLNLWWKICQSLSIKLYYNTRARQSESVTCYPGLYLYLIVNCYTTKRSLL